MTDELELHARVLDMRRLRNSSQGNPRWYVAIQDLDVERLAGLNTKVDAAVNHLISESFVGKQVVITIDGRGEIIRMEVDE